MGESISPEFAKALVLVQGQMEAAQKEKSNPAFRSRYADLGNCWDAVRDALQANSVAVLQFPRKADPGYVGMYTALVYGPTGEVFGYEYSVPLKDPTNPQAMGSAITYARRYALCSVLGISVEDDDGNKAAAPAATPRPSKPQPVADTVELWNLFNGGDLDKKKAIYTQTRNANIDEPAKTALLSKMADVIKAMKQETK